MTTQVGLGFSQRGHPLEAGRRATEQALEPLAGREPDLLILFSTTDLEPRQVMAGVRGVAGEVPLVGGCSAGVIVPQGAFRSGVAVMALRSEEMRIAVDMVSGLSQDPTAVSQTLVRRLWTRQDENHQALNRLLLALVDSQVSAATATAVQAMGNELGPLSQLVGGGVKGNDSSRRPSRPTFLNGEAYADAVAAALFLTPGPVGVGVRHGFRAIGRPLVVTRAAGNIVYELDGRPAFEAYMEQFPDHSELTPQNFGQFALDYPLGLPQMGREHIVRDPFGAQPDGALLCAGVIPEHVVVRIMTGDLEMLIQSAREAAIEAMQPLGERRPLLALVFGCVSRLAYLGARAQDEVAAIREVLGAETPFAGLFSFGEIAAQLDSPPNLHNKTTVVGLVGEM